MRRIFGCALLAAFVTTRGLGSFERYPVDPRLAAMSGAGSSRAGQVWGSLTNPAGLVGNDRMVIALSFVPSPFELEELRRNTAAVVFPFQAFTASLSASEYGFEDYREVFVRVSCALQIAGTVQAGVTTGYNRMSIRGYGSGEAMTFDVGLIWRIAGDFSLGCTATNVNAPAIGLSREEIPQSFTLGASWIPSAGFLVAVDLVKDAAFLPEVGFGIEYQPVEGFFLRGGVANEPASYSAGFGVRLGGFGLDYAFSRHPDLGMTHHIGLTLAIEVG